jgi:DNA-binding MarR family transcriptional regulator
VRSDAAAQRAGGGERQRKETEGKDPAFYVMQSGSPPVALANIAPASPRRYVGTYGVVNMDASDKERAVADYNRGLGGAAIGARLRRLSERIDRDANRVYAGAGVKFEQRWLGVLEQIAAHGPMSVGELSNALRISHPSVSQTKNSLQRAGLITEQVDLRDGRRRALRITRKGSLLVKKLQPVWDVLDEVGRNLNAEAGDAVAALNRLEDALDRLSIFDRVRAASSSAGRNQQAKELTPVLSPGRS